MNIINRRKKNEHDIIFENLNKYHPKINLTIEVNPCKFLDTKIINNKGNITTEVFRKTSKLYPCIGHPGFQSGTSEML